jgi:hypothetical protein
METEHSIYTTFKITAKELWVAIPEDVEERVLKKLGIPSGYSVEDSNYEDGVLNLYASKEVVDDIKEITLP